MYLGYLFEYAQTETLFEEPLAPYTRTLISAVPAVTEEEIRIKPADQSRGGDTPSPVNPPSGCVFHPRCTLADSICSEKMPALEEVKPGHFVRCHHVSRNIELSSRSGAHRATK